MAAQRNLFPQYLSRQCDLDFTEIQPVVTFNGPKHWRLQKFFLALDRYNYALARERRRKLFAVSN